MISLAFSFSVGLVYGATVDQNLFAQISFEFQISGCNFQLQSNLVYDSCLTLNDVGMIWSG